MAADILSDLAPSDIGLGSVYPSFRPQQLEAIEQAIYGEERFQGLNLPTGSGKTGVGLAIPKLIGWRTVIVTATNGLLDQYMRDGQQVGLVEMKGKSNYNCVAGIGAKECEEGGRKNCGLRVPGKTFQQILQNNLESRLIAPHIPSCTYDAQRMIANLEQMVVTNYAYWLYARNGLSRVDCLVLDEGHDAPSQLANYMSVKLYEKEVIEHMGLKKEDLPASEDVAEWAGWAGIHSGTLGTLGESIKALKTTLPRLHGQAHDRAMKSLKGMEKLQEKLDLMQGMESDWTCEKKESGYGRSWHFDSIWPGKYAESRLFKGIPKVILMSATLRPKTLSMLGIPKDQYKFTEWGRVFPPNRCPVYYLPTVRMNHKTSQEDLLKWVERIDQIIESRPDRKGIIHTVSYARQQFLLEHSKFKEIMVNNDKDPDGTDAMEAYEQFKKLKPPAVLVSPSFSTGWDFKGVLAEFQIIGKIAFPDSRSKVMQARMERDDEHGNYIAMQDLLQACGRVMRDEKDRGETFVIDSSLGWFIGQNKTLAPRWFVDGIRRIQDVPVRPEKLQ